jgi:hypothetical protein
MAKLSTPTYQIKVTLDDTHPLIWRRILVPGNTTLLKLHDILQIAMGWEDYHLHMYKIEGNIYGNPTYDEYGDLGTEDEANHKLSQVIFDEGQRFTYEYDFGDSWAHTLLVEKILPPEENIRSSLCLKGKRACPPEDVGGVWGYANFLEAIHDSNHPDHEEYMAWIGGEFDPEAFDLEETTRPPLCLKGKRACPPEDVGGVWGYANFLEAIHDSNHPDHEEYMAWIGGEFDPEAFDLEETNTRLRNMGRGRSKETSNAWFMEEDAFVEKEIDLVSSWLYTLPDDQQAVAENLPLRRDMITLLAYLRDNKVTGTQSTGNLPLKAVHEICAQFVHPPKLGKTVEERTYRVRSETEVWPLYFRHVLASVGGLATGGPSRRWKLTPLGDRFLAVPAPLQVWLLLVTWWTQTNWTIASQYGFEDGHMPAGFAKLTLMHLLVLPTGDLVPFEPFADQIIEDAGLVWPIQDQDIGRRILHGIIERVVIDPLVDFGVVQDEYEPHKILGEGFRELSAFRITPFGRGLLEAIHEEAS